MAYLITGAAGLIASQIANQLAEAGHTVVGYSRKPDPETIALVMSQRAQENLVWVAGDVLDYELLTKTIKQHDVHTIFHYAAILGDTILDDPRYATRVNCEGTINCYQAARELGLKKVVFASSNGAFPYQLPEKPQSQWTIDDYVIYPWGMYGAAKQYGEHAAEFYFRNWGTDITSVRICFGYGPGHMRGKTADLMRELVIKPALGEPGVTEYGADYVDNFMHSDDLARAAILAAGIKRSPEKGIVYNLKGPEASAGEILGYVKEFLPDAQVSFQGTYFPETNHGYDSEATERDLGFYPKYSMREGVKLTINRVREHAGLPLV